MIMIKNVFLHSKIHGTGRFNFVAPWYSFLTGVDMPDTLTRSQVRFSQRLEKVTMHETVC